MQLTSSLENKLQSGDKNVRKRALNHTRQDSQEAARVASDEVLDKCALLSFNVIINRKGEGRLKRITEQEPHTGLFQYRNP
jgi:hypothetical protein